MPSAVADTQIGSPTTQTDVNSRRYQIASSALDFGMFVAELDRPWLDTPFLMQGFLLSEQIEIDTIRKFSAYAYVDFDLSRPELRPAILKADLNDPANSSSLGRSSGPQISNVQAKSAVEEPKFVAPTRRNDRPVKIRSDLKIDDQTREKFQSLIKNQQIKVSAAPGASGGGISRLFSWLKGQKSSEQQLMELARARHEARANSVAGLMPQGFTLHQYRSANHDIRTELPRARNTFDRSEKVLADLATDLKAGKIPQLKEVQGAVIDMVDSMIDNPDALMWVAKLKEENVSVYNHGVKVALYLVALGRQIGFPKQELAHLGMIGMLADVGKTKLPRAVLEKPGVLTGAEHALIKEHVNVGLNILKQNMKLPGPVEQGIAQHHERLDGTGYPNKLRAEQIGVYGRMAAIADVFSALVTPRTYANPSAPQDALMSLYQWAGKSLHEPLVEQFVQAVGVFPVGTLVELSNGSVSVVLAHNKVRRLEPIVLVLTNEHKSALPEPIELDLRKGKINDKGEKLRIVRGLPSGAYGLKLRDYYMTQVGKANGIPG